MWKLEGLAKGEVRPSLSLSFLQGRLTPNATRPQTAPHATLPSLAPQTPLLDLLPNPDPSSPLLAVVHPSAPLTIYDLSSTSPSATTFPTRGTSACWSVKGKQLAVGLPADSSGGAVAQFTPQGERKASLARPASLTEGTYEACAVEWLENHVFVVTYGRPRGEEEGGEPQHEDEVVVLTRGADGQVRETRFGDPAPPFGMMDRVGRRWVARFRAWCVALSLCFIRRAWGGQSEM